MPSMQSSCPARVFQVAEDLGLHVSMMQSMQSSWIFQDLGHPSIDYAIQNVI